MSTSAALERLFELLEEYAPVWYTEEHHNLAVDALAQSAEKFASAAEPVDASRLDLESHRYNARGTRTGRPHSRSASRPSIG